MKNVLLLSALLAAGSLCAAPTRHSERLAEKESQKKEQIVSVFDGANKENHVTKQDRKNFEALQVSLFNKNNKKTSLKSLNLAGFDVTGHEESFGLITGCATPIKPVSPCSGKLTPQEVDPITQIRKSARLAAQLHKKLQCIGCDNY